MNNVLGIIRCLWYIWYSVRRFGSRLLTRLQVIVVAQTLYSSLFRYKWQQLGTKSGSFETPFIPITPQNNGHCPEGFYFNGNFVRGCPWLASVWLLLSSAGSVEEIWGGARLNLTHLTSWKSYYFNSWKSITRYFLKQFDIYWRNWRELLNTRLHPNKREVVTLHTRP
jgi:hypothetical protein